MPVGQLVNPSARRWLAVMSGLIAALLSTASAETLEEVIQLNGVYTLKSVSRPEGTIYMWGTAAGFSSVDWLDGASVATGWKGVEKTADQTFSWGTHDNCLTQVRNWNTAHPDKPRHVQPRVVGGRWCPDWFASAGVAMYETYDSYIESGKVFTCPVPYDNPEYLKQLRQLCQEIYRKYRNTPEVRLFHVTWSGGPWEEIFHPRNGATMPPNYTKAKFIQGHLDQLGIVIDELSMKGMPAEMSFSGIYPKSSDLNLTDTLRDRIVARLGKHSPYFYINSDGWGQGGDGIQRINQSHEPEISRLVGYVNIGAQALGDNYGTKPSRQGDWVNLVQLAKPYGIFYAEVYASDIIHLDTAHRIVQAFTQTQAQADSGLPGTVPGFLGFGPWLKQRSQQLYVRDGTLTRSVVLGSSPRQIFSIVTDATVPASTSLTVTARTRVGSGAWSAWMPAAQVLHLPAGTEAQVRAAFHTDDGYFSPQLRSMSVRTDAAARGNWKLFL